ncbi:hypothetical protein PIB30_076397 [Stylosanthes scabra]|uniref:Uncharacterized protein n=1 Tax=Stylosanthes scabra TaxID=79078 RepID=A0ABU6QPU0_9FABA|nr:hypothetical protein [Stylosanthes scabra]
MLLATKSETKKRTSQKSNGVTKRCRSADVDDPLRQPANTGNLNYRKTKFIEKKRNWVKRSPIGYCAFSLFNYFSPLSLTIVAPPRYKYERSSSPQIFSPLCFPSLSAPNSPATIFRRNRRTITAIAGGKSLSAAATPRISLR